VVLNVDGLDWKRKKWGRLARAFIQMSERWATRFPHQIVTDSRRVQEYYGARYGARTHYIAYGAEPMTVAPGAYVAHYGLTPGQYVLFVGRLVPENCAHHLVEAFQGLATDFRCVIVGDAPYAAAYIGALQRGIASSSRAISLAVPAGHNAYCFVETSEVGARIRRCWSHGIQARVCQRRPENLETIGEAGFSYDGAMGGPTRSVWNACSDRPCGTTGRAKRVREHYSWDAVTDAYEGLFRELLGARR
jgi:glycosyltransferase involved in cell wall biosynthesis